MMETIETVALQQKQHVSNTAQALRKQTHCQLCKPCAAPCTDLFIRHHLTQMCCDRQVSRLSRRIDDIRIAQCGYKIVVSCRANQSRLSFEEVLVSGILTTTWQHTTEHERQSNRDTVIPCTTYTRRVLTSLLINRSIICGVPICATSCRCCWNARVVVLPSQLKAALPSRPPREAFTSAIARPYV